MTNEVPNLWYLRPIDSDLCLRLLQQDQTILFPLKDLLQRAFQEKYPSHNTDRLFSSTVKYYQATIVHINTLLTNTILRQNISAELKAMLDVVRRHMLDDGLHPKLVDTPDKIIWLLNSLVDLEQIH